MYENYEFLIIMYICFDDVEWKEKNDIHQCITDVHRCIYVFDDDDEWTKKKLIYTNVHFKNEYTPMYICVYQCISVLMMNEKTNIHQCISVLMMMNEKTNIHQCISVLMMLNDDEWKNEYTPMYTVVYIPRYNFNSIYNKYVWVYHKH